MKRREGQERTSLREHKGGIECIWERKKDGSHAVYKQKRWGKQDHVATWMKHHEGRRWATRSTRQAQERDSHCCHTPRCRRHFVKKGLDETMDGCLSCACTISTSVVRVYMLMVLMTRTCQCEAVTNIKTQVQVPEPDVTRTAKWSSCVVVVVCYQDHRDTRLLPSVSTISVDFEPFMRSVCFDCFSIVKLLAMLTAHPPYFIGVLPQLFNLCCFQSRSLILYTTVCVCFVIDSWERCLNFEATQHWIRVTCVSDRVSLPFRVFGAWLDR